MTDAPRTRIEKLGVKPRQRACLLAVDDPALPRELARAGVRQVARVVQGCELVFLGVRRAVDLARLATVERRMARAGAVWAVWPKGRSELHGDHVRRAALAAGLVDVKVISFSDTHTGLKLVIPLARR